MLRVEGLRLAPHAEPITTEVRSAEILGLAGLEGHGQELFLQRLCGLSLASSGTVTVPRGPKESKDAAIIDLKSAARHGISYVPRDRKAEGIFPSLSVLDNFSISWLDLESRFGFIRRTGLIRRYDVALSKLQIAAASPDASITSLSGGNQQKVLVARALETGSRVLLLNDPTRGVDTSSARGLHEILCALARAGLAIVLLSTEISELVEICDRALVFHRGSLVGEYVSPLDEGTLLAGMFGRKSSSLSAEPRDTGLGLGEQSSRTGGARGDLGRGLD